MLVRFTPASHTNQFNSQNCKLTVSCCKSRQMAELKKFIMLRLFRRIRTRSLAENKFTKYLLYAVGEIILVVIGILIALSINNRNDFRKDRLAEKLLLENLVKDLEDQQELNMITEVNMGYLAIIDTVL